MNSSPDSTTDSRKDFQESKDDKQSNDDKTKQSEYECNICFDIANDAVISFCGHLFCWPCLHQWLEARKSCQTCPVCKAGISRDKVIPLYGRNNGNGPDKNKTDPRDKVPPRPVGQRLEPENNQNFGGFNFSENFSMSFGIGAFPFGIFSAVNLGERNGIPVGNNNDEAFLSKMFLYIAIIFIFWLLLA